MVLEELTCSLKCQLVLAYSRQKCSKWFLVQQNHTNKPIFNNSGSFLLEFKYSFESNYSNVFLCYLKAN